MATKIRIRDLPVLDPGDLSDLDVLPISDNEGLTTYKLSLATLKSNQMIDVLAVTDTKEDILTGAASGIAHSDLPIDSAVITSGTGKVIASTISTTELETLTNITSNIQSQLDNKAELNSPTLTGNPTAPTPTWSDNDTSIATTAFVNSLMDWDGIRLKIRTPDGVWRQVYPGVFGA